MSGRLQDRVGIVTGAARGIGRAIAQRFAAEGCRVVVADVDAAGGADTAAGIVAAGGTALAVETDVADAEAVAALVQTARERLGTPRILVNNAVCSSQDVQANTWGPIIGVCLQGTYLCTQAVLPLMIEAGGGSIVNISSVNALMGFGDEHVYSAAKAAVIGLTRSQATAYGPQGVRINAICPGTIVTEAWEPLLAKRPSLHDELRGLYPLGRLGTPEDIAHAALYLASDEAAFATGTVLVVDGGVTAGHLSFKLGGPD
jgi:3-oxoacyl-[acyl-carrier protein] reductase